MTTRLPAIPLEVVLGAYSLYMSYGLALTLQYAKGKGAGVSRVTGRHQRWKARRLLIPSHDKFTLV